MTRLVPALMGAAIIAAIYAFAVLPLLQNINANLEAVNARYMESAQ